MTDVTNSGINLIEEFDCNLTKAELQAQLHHVILAILPKQCPEIGNLVIDNRFQAALLFI